MIAEWYESAAGESATSRDAEMFSLLEKLGIKASHRDLHFGNPDHWIDEHRPVIAAQNAAIADYLRGHPELMHKNAENR